MKEISVLGIDIAKLVFHAVGLDKKGNVVLRKRIYRGELEEFLSSLSPVSIAMEACATSNYWARRCKEYGHRVKLIPAQFVKPYVKTNKNDTIDAEAIAEAMTRPSMRFVVPKSVDQQDIQCLHRIRERLVKQRTSLINEMRGLLGEYGIILPQGRYKFCNRILEALEREGEKLTPLSRELFYGLYQELGGIQQRLAGYEKQIEQISKAHPECQRLMQIPGVGQLTATALIAAVGDPGSFKNGRQFAAWLGLVPRQHSTGGKPRLGRISKRGDCYLRKLLVHGARSDLKYVKTKMDRRSQWALKLQERSGTNKAVVALANKTARTIWAMLVRGEDYRVFPLTQAR